MTKTAKPMPRDARKRAGKSLEWVAVTAGVSSPTIRLFELAGPAAIADERKRAAIVAVYEGFSAVGAT